MALSQFGGRPGSGSGSGSAADGKEVGEVFLVPNTFASTDVVEAGSTVTAASQPTLFPKLVDGGAVAGFAKYDFPMSDLIIGSRFNQGIVHQGEWFALTVDGKVGSTADGVNWTSRGTPISTSTLPDSFLWPQPSTPNPAARGTAMMYSLGTRLVVINTMVKFVVGAYTDNKGATWTSFSDTTMNTVFAANLPGTLPMTIFGGVGYAIMVDLVSKKIYRSTTGISNWTDVTPVITFPTTPSLNKPASYADATSAVWWFGNTMVASADAGVTWTASTLAATTSAQYGLVSLIKWNGAMYCAGTYNGVGSFYKNTDMGSVYTASGTLASGMPSGSLYIGADGNMGVYGASGQFVTTTTGAAWTLVGVASPIASSIMFSLYPSGAGYGVSAVSTTYGVIRNTTDHAVTWVTPNKPAYIGTPGGMMYVDSATNDSGLTVIVGAPYVNSGSERPSTHDTNLSGNFYATTKTYYYGSFEAGWTVGQMPTADVWAGITWNKYAGIFIATALNTNGIFTSPDGINWTTTSSATLGFTPRNLPPRTFGLITVFIPGFNTATNLFMLIGRGDGTWFPQKTAYTRAWPTYGVGQKAVEFNKDYVVTGTSGGYCFPDATLITSAVNVNNPAAWSPGAGDQAAAHGPVLVSKTSAGIYYINSTAAGKLALSSIPAATYVDTGNLLAIWAKDGVITAYIGESLSGQFGVRVRTTTDNGVTWSNAATNSIPSTERMFAGRTIGNTVLLIGATSTYAMNAANGGVTPTSKTVSTGWVAPAGLKYVVKAK